MSNLQVYDGGLADRSGPNELLSCPRAEASIVVACTTDAAVLDAVQDLLRQEHFESSGHALVFATILELRGSGKDVSFESVHEALRSTDRLRRIGGSEGFYKMVEGSGALSPRSARTLARGIVSTWARRALLGAATAAQTRASMDAADVGAILADHRAKVDGLLTSLTSEQKNIDARSVMIDAAKLAQSAAQNVGVGARPTGFHGLDRLTAGLHSELVLIGARPGMGKTSLATSIAVNVADRGETAYIASLETPAATLGLRMACAIAGVSMHAARAGMMTPTDWSKITSAMGAIAQLPVFFDDESAVRVMDLWTRCRRAALLSGKRLGVVVVDFIQLLQPPRNGMKREEAVAENARALKAMAQDLDCPVLALAQLNRASEQRTDHRPTLADLRESGELEQCARTVLFIYRKDYYKKPGEVKTNEAEVIVAKQNNGPTGSVMMTFNGDCLRFTEMADGYYE